MLLMDVASPDWHLKTRISSTTTTTTTTTTRRHITRLALADMNTIYNTATLLLQQQRQKQLLLLLWVGGLA